jgi:hypothetical protein
MAQNRFPLKGDAARAYETRKVPAVFEPLAALTLEHIEIRPGARVIDVAYGTDIVARLAAGAPVLPRKGCGAFGNPQDLEGRRAPRAEHMDGAKRAIPCDPDARARIVEERASKLAAFRTAEGFSIPQGSHPVLARASGEAVP